MEINQRVRNHPTGVTPSTVSRIRTPSSLGPWRNRPTDSIDTSNGASNVFKLEIVTNNPACKKALVHEDCTASLIVWSKCRIECWKIGRIGFPAIDGARVNRLAHLPAAGGLYRASIGVKVEAAVVPGHAEKGD